MLLAGLSPAAQAAQPDEGDESLERTLAQVGRRVEQWFTRATSVVAREEVAIQPLESNLTPAGFARRLEYETQMAWEPGDDPAGRLEASVVRHLLAVNGRSPGPDDEPGCMDPKPISPEPLAMLLPARRAEFEFTLAGTGRVDRREAVMVDYQSAEAVPAEVAWEGDCVTISAPGQSQGRIWIDTTTHDVLRLDERLVGYFEVPVPQEHIRRGAARSLVVERATLSIRYRPVTFEDPGETLVLPTAIDTLTVIRGGGIRRHRITRRLSDYRRFLTEGRLLPP